MTTEEHGTAQPRLIRLAASVGIGGSIVQRGRPVAAAKVFLVPVDRTCPGFLGDWTSTTDDRGRFSFKDLPSGADAELVFDIETLKHLGAIPPRKVRTPPPAAPDVALDPIEVGPSRKVAGRVVFRDGKKVPAGTILGAGVAGGWSSQAAQLDADGRFEVTGLPPGVAVLTVRFPNNTYTPKGFRLSAENRSLNPSAPHSLTGLIDRDVADLTILFERGPAWSTDGTSNTGEAITTDPSDLETEPVAGVPATPPKP